MRRILIGTTNPSKAQWMTGYLSALEDVQCLSLRDLGISVDISENGNTPEENARIKAMAYHKATGLAVITEDSGLYFQEFPMDDPRQPGLFIRRVNGKELTDDEMLEYYSGLARQFGPLHACYCNGFAAVDENGRAETFAQDRADNTQFVSTFGFLMCAEPHPMRRPGWPLDSLSKNLETGQYWFDQGDGSRSIADSDFSRNYQENVFRFYSHFFRNQQA